MPTKLQTKLILVTEDGVNFLCIRQLYASDLYTGDFIDGKLYQGKRFKLISEEQNEDDPKSNSPRT
jgi:hypothetical protein